MNTLYKKYIILVLLLVTSTLLFAQTNPPVPNPPPPGLPIDGGILLAGIIALLYGVNRKMN